MKQQKFILASFAILIALALSLSAIAGIGTQSMQVESAPSHTGLIATADASYSAYGVEPDPTLNSNVTWSSYNGTWINSLEYQSGAMQNNTSILPASMSALYKNPISVNPSDIIAPKILQGDKIAGQYWNDTSGAAYSHPTGQINGTYGQITVNGQNVVYEKVATSSKYANAESFSYAVPASAEPSNNPAYDYITMTGQVSSTATQSGQYLEISFFSEDTSTSTTTSISTIHPAIYPGQSFYFSENLEQIEGTHTGAFTNASYIMLINPILETSETSTAATVSMTITGMALTSYPLTLGTQISNGAQRVVSKSVNATTTMNKFSPSFPYQKIADNGYSVAVSQPLQNITTSQTSINNGIYTESVTYQGIESLPSAPDLSYSNSNITMPMKISGKQFQVANLNGISYLSEVQAKSNGTFSFGSVNANSQNSIILEVEYTASQWNSVSAPPSFWTEPVQAIEYYWYIALGVLLGGIGLGSWAGSKSDALRGVKK
jgi:hypothetical protein